MAKRGELLTSEKGGKGGVEFPGGDTVGGGAVAIDLDAELGNDRLLVEFTVFETGQAFGDGLDLDAEIAEGIEIGAEDFDGDGSGDSAEHMADAIGQRSHDHAKGSWDALDFFTDLREDFGAGPLWSVAWGGGAKIDIEFCGADGNDMIAAFSASETSADFVNFWNGE